MSADVGSNHLIPHFTPVAASVPRPIGGKAAGRSRSRFVQSRPGAHGVRLTNIHVRGHYLTDSHIGASIRQDGGNRRSRDVHG